MFVWEKWLVWLFFNRKLHTEMKWYIYTPTQNEWVKGISYYLILFVRLCFSKTCLHSGLQVTYFLAAILYHFLLFELPMFKIIPPPSFFNFKRDGIFFSCWLYFFGVNILLWHTLGCMFKLLIFLMHLLWILNNM